MPTFAEIIFLALLIVIAPTLALRSKRRLDENSAAEAPYSALLFSILITHGTLLAFALYLRPGLPASPAYASRGDAPTLIACAVFLALSGGMSILRWRATGEDRRRRLRLYLPKAPVDHALAIVLHAFVAIVEEVVYRAVMFAIVDRLCVHIGLPPWWPAAIMCSAAFGVAHIVQGWHSALVIGFLGIGFHIIVRVSGGLAAAIITHFIFDTVAIAIYARLLKPRAGP
jgi:membrane protease YdiL (CAAX protease family)